MPQTIRYHLDEHGSRALAAGLHRRGIDVTRTPDVKLRQAADADHLAFARSEGRVIFTQDEDYLIFHANGEPHAGIVYCHQGSRSLGQIIASLVLYWEVYDAGDLVGKVEFI